MITHTQTPRQAQAVGAVTLAATGFSLGFIIAKGIRLPPTTVAFGRTWAGALLLLAVVRARRRGLSWLPPRDAWRPVILAGLSFGAHQMLFISASQATSISIVTLLQGLQPLLVAMVSRRLLDEPVPRALAGASMAAVGGVATVVLANQHDASHSATGDLLAVLNLFAFLGYFLASKLARNTGLDSLSLTAWSLTVAAVVLTPGFIARGDWTLPAAWQLGLILFHAWIPGNGHILVNWAHSHSSAALASVLLSLVPVLASLWAYLLFDEPYGVWHIVGTLLTLGAIEAGRRAGTAPKELQALSASTVTKQRT